MTTAGATSASRWRFPGWRMLALAAAAGVAMGLITAAIVVFRMSAPPQGGRPDGVDVAGFMLLAIVLAPLEEWLFRGVILQKLIKPLGIDPHRVQRILRHSDVRTTTGVYDHLLVEDLRAVVNAIAPNSAPFVPSLSQGSSQRARQRSESEQKPKRRAKLEKRATQDSNLWPLAPEAIETNMQTVADCSQSLANPSDSATSDLQQLSEKCSILPQRGAPVGAPFSEPPERLLRVRDVAARLDVSTATVYKLAHSGVMPFVRILGSLRFRSKDLESFISSSSNASRD